MGGSSSGSSSRAVGNGSGTFDFQQLIPAYQLPYLDTNLASQQGTDNYTRWYLQNYAPQAFAGLNQANWQASPAWANQLNGGVYQGMNLQNQMSNLLNQKLDSNTQRIYGQIMGGAGNTYADAMREQYIKDANRSYENMLSNLDARAAASGMSGSSRHGVAEGIGARGINDALQGNLAQLGYETFDKDLQNKLAIAQMADTNNLNLLNNQIGTTAGLINNMGNTQATGINNLQNMQAARVAPLSAFTLSSQAGNKLDPTVLSSGEGAMSALYNSKGSSSSKGGGIK